MRRSRYYLGFPLQWCLQRAESPNMPAKKPRLLCLHGSKANGTVSEMQMMVLGTIDYCDCDCIDSAQIVAGKMDQVRACVACAQSCIAANRPVCA